MAEMISMEAYHAGLDVQINAALWWKRKYEQLEMAVAPIIEAAGGRVEVPSRLMVQGGLTIHRDQDIANDSVIWSVSEE